MLSRLPRRSWSGSISKLRTIVSTRTLATSVCRADHKAYSATLLLPKTSLPLKHKDPVAAEHAYRSRTTDELYKSQVSINHPWALTVSGPQTKASFSSCTMVPRMPMGTCTWVSTGIYVDQIKLTRAGHALNKILKDIISRYQVLRGRQVQ